MTLDETELEILRRFVAQHEAAGAKGEDDKCARELNLRQVVQGVTGKAGPDLDYHFRFWWQRLVGRPAAGYEVSLLRQCSRGHSENARAYMTGAHAPAWERVQELERQLGQSVSEREKEQKFGILWSSAQAVRDFNNWTNEGRSSEIPVVIIFLDIDHFKSLNTKLTETIVDRTTFPAFQNLLERLVRHRGFAYREGGEEFVLLLGNHTIDEAVGYAERVRMTIADESFVADDKPVSLTVSIGVARFPDHGTNYGEVKLAANQSKAAAKEKGRNRVVVAQIGRSP